MVGDRHKELMMDPNFYKIELYERERRKDEIRQAQKARLARSGANVDQSPWPSRLQSSFGRALANFGTRLYQFGSRMAGTTVSDQHPASNSYLELNSSSTPGAL